VHFVTYVSLKFRNLRKTAFFDTHEAHFVQQDLLTLNMRMIVMTNLKILKNSKKSQISIVFWNNDETASDAKKICLPFFIVLQEGR
jgi:hypothetical protein